MLDHTHTAPSCQRPSSTTLQCLNAIVSDPSTSYARGIFRRATHTRTGSCFSVRVRAASSASPCSRCMLPQHRILQRDSLRLQKAASPQKGQLVQSLTLRARSSPPSAASSSPHPTPPNPSSYRNAAPPQPATPAGSAYCYAYTPCS
jgi:hypothetical protein